MTEETSFDDYLDRLDASSDPAEMLAFAIYQHMASHYHFYRAFNNVGDFDAINFVEGIVKVARETTSL